MKFVLNPNSNQTNSASESIPATGDADQLLGLDKVGYAAAVVASTPRTWNLVPARSEPSLDMTAPLACRKPRYTVLISTLPHITRNSHLQ